MTVDFSQASPRQVIDQIFQDGKVEQAEVDALRARLDADWKISCEEAELLFRINDAPQESESNSDAWSAFFIDALVQFSVFDMNSPGEIESEEANWLIDQLVQHPVLDQNEEALLHAIKKQATRIDDKLIEFVHDPRP